MKGKRLFLIYFVLFFMITAAWLWLWTMEAESQAHYTPEYAKIDLEPIIQKETLSRADYELLFQQTGLGRAAVEALYTSGRQSLLLYLQQRFFAEVEVECSHINIVTRSERLVKQADSPADGNAFAAWENEGLSYDYKPLQEPERGAFLPAAEPGDVLVTFSGHVFGWRSGHAAIVVDAGKGLTLEAVTMGTDSRLSSLNNWEEYPCFALLRLKNVSAEARAEIAAYAVENLKGIPYRLTSFTDGGRKTAETRENDKTETFSGTQCAHLVWSAFAHFGYNLDSDGGYIVTPADLFQSSLLEAVQIYGLPPE